MRVYRFEGQKINLSASPVIDSQLCILVAAKIVSGSYMGHPPSLKPWKDAASRQKTKTHKKFWKEQVYQNSAGLGSDSKNLL